VSNCERRVKGSTSGAFFANEKLRLVFVSRHPTAAHSAREPTRDRSVGAHSLCCRLDSHRGWLVHRMRYSMSCIIMICSAPVVLPPGQERPHSRPGSRRSCWYAQVRVLCVGRMQTSSHLDAVCALSGFATPCTRKREACGVIWAQARQTMTRASRAGIVIIRPAQPHALRSDRVN
jgi:hypothetical protein